MPCRFFQPPAPAHIPKSPPYGRSPPYHKGQKRRVQELFQILKMVQRSYGDKQKSRDEIQKNNLSLFMQIPQPQSHNRSSLSHTDPVPDPPLYRHPAPSTYPSPFWVCISPPAPTVSNFFLSLVMFTVRVLSSTKQSLSHRRFIMVSLATVDPAFSNKS